MSHYLQKQFFEVLRKPEKTLEDGIYIYETIKKDSIFDNLFAQHLKTMDFDSILTLCQGFQYEHIPIGNFVFKKGDACNEKFYFILSGQASVIMPQNEKKKRKVIVHEDPQPQQNQANPEDPLHIKLPEDEAFATLKTEENEISPNQRRFNIEPRNISSASGSPTRTRSRRLRTTMTNFNEGGITLTAGIRALRKVGSLCKIVAAFSIKSKVENQEDLSSLPQEAPKEESPKLPLRHDEEIKEEIDPIIDFTDNEKFEQYASKFGKLVRTLVRGESFGEKALENNEPRSATILCRTDCEFLIITKQHFDVVFQKQIQEKENFLKGVFPLLGNAMISSNALGYLLYSFKLETYSKGTYLTSEGKTNDKEPKLYVINRGECLVEKTLIIELKTPYKKNQPLTKEVINTQIAVVGKGMIVGEEILLTQNEYNYSAKVVSENLQVYAITREDFEKKFFKEFKDHVMGIYERKRRQRELICDNARKEYETKAEQYKPENIFSMKTLPIKHLISKSAMQGLTRYIQRERVVPESREQTQSFATLPASAQTKLRTDYSLVKMRTYEESTFFEGDSSTHKSVTVKQKKQIIEGISTLNSKDQDLDDMETRIEFLSRLPSVQKKRKESLPQNDVEAVRLFTDNDPRKIKLYQHIQKKVSNRYSTPNAKAYASNDNVISERRKSIILKSLAKNATKFKFIAPELGNVKQPQEEEGENQALTGQSMKLKKTVSALSIPVYSSKSVPRKRKTTQNAFLDMYDVKANKTMNTAANVRNSLPKGLTINVDQERGSMRVENLNNLNLIVDMSSSSETSVTLGRFKLLQLDEVEKEDDDKLQSQTEDSSPIKRSNTLTNLFNSETRDINWSPKNKVPDLRDVKTANPNSPAHIRTEDQPFQVKYQRVHSQVHPNGTTLQNARALRKKVFKKPAKIFEPIRIPIAKLVVSNSPLVSPKDRK